MHLIQMSSGRGILKIADKHDRWQVLIALVAVLLPVAIGLSHNVFRPYTVTPDADLIYLGQALRLGDGIRQTFFDHTGHAYIILLRAWLELLAGFGAVPHPSEAAAIASENIDSYIQPLTVGARFLSILIGSAFTAMMAAGLRGMGYSCWIALAGALIFASSPALTTQTLIMRSEMLSAMGACAMFFALVQAQRSTGARHAIWMMLAGVCGIVALDAKVQAIIVLLGMPVLVLALGPCRKPPSKPELVTIGQLAFIAFALAVIVPFATVIWFSITTGELRGPLTGYQFGIVLLIISCMLLYGKLYRESSFRQIKAMISLAAGFSIGSAIFFIWHNHTLIDALVHFVEHMSAFSATTITRTPVTTILQRMLETMASDRANGILTPSGVLSLLAIGLIYLMVRQRDYKRATMMVFLIGFGLAIEAAFSLRGYRPTYHIYVDPWLFIAIATGCAAPSFLPSQRLKMCFAAGILIVTCWQTALSLTPGMITYQPLYNVCNQAKTYLVPALADRFSAYCR